METFRVEVLVPVTCKYNISDNQIEDFQIFHNGSDITKLVSNAVYDDIKEEAYDDLKAQSAAYRMDQRD